MTKDEFIAGYCERSHVEWQELQRSQVALPCACGDKSCCGWAMVSNNRLSVQTHMQLYAPDTDTPAVGAA
jgi:hypothetical protein